MNLQYLKYFSVLAKTEHVTKAAEILAISQPSLSNAIHALEKEYNVKLYEKNGRNITLTKYGRQLAEYLDRGFHEIEEGEQLLLRMANPTQGHVDIGFFNSLGTFFIPELIRTFLAQPGYGQFTFTYGSGSDIKLRDGLKKGDFDLTFCSIIWPNEELEYIKVAEQRMFVIVSQDHPLAKKDIISIKELEGLPFISYTQPCSLQTTINLILSDAHVNVNHVHFSEQGATIAGMVAANFGVSILPDIPLPDLNIKKLEVEEGLPPRNIYISRDKNKYLSASARTFLEYSKKHCVEIQSHSNSLSYNVNFPKSYT